MKKRIRCKKGATEIERIMLHIVIDFATGCWVWQGGKTVKYKYATTSVNVDGKTINVMAYRHSFAIFIGPIPDGLEIDHLCRNPGCVNPWHLEAVTHLVNVRRGGRAQQTHCKHGHEFTPENIYTWKKRPGRACVICRSNMDRNRNRNKKSEVTAA